MSFINISFYIFLLINLVIYYIVPKNFRWIWLLAISYIYYFSFSIKAALIMLFVSFVTYVGAIIIEKIQENGNLFLDVNKDQLTKEEKKNYKAIIKKRKRIALIIILLLDFSMLLIFKYTDFAISNINGILGIFGAGKIKLLKLGLPIGISFYTFQSVSYVIDVFQGKYKCQKNFFKLALFVSFFPQILQGPIGRYDKLSSQLYDGREYKIENVLYGIQRIGWGMFKKLVLADRTAVVVNQIFNNYEQYTGPYYILAVLMYSIQLYMDFSGGVDVVIGTSQMFGITMTENFNQPYFSKSIGEFWRRWHISLGAWMKDYIFYPMSLSKRMNKLGKICKKKFGNTVGKTLPICFTNILIFFIVGVWHGASWKYIVYGLYNGFIIAFSNLCEPLYIKAFDKLKIDNESKAWKRWQIIRTFILVNIGWYFDMALDLKSALYMIIHTFVWTPGIDMSNEAFMALGLSTRDYLIIFFACIIVFVVSLLKERGIKIRESIAKKNIIIRWALYYGIILVILILGYFGESQGFLYANF